MDVSFIFIEITVDLMEYARCVDITVLLKMVHLCVTLLSLFAVDLDTYISRAL